MSGIIFEDDEDDGAAELERILEESGEDEQDDDDEEEVEEEEEEEEETRVRLARPRSAMPCPRTAPGGKTKAIHWNDGARVVMSSTGTSSPASSRASSPGRSTTPPPRSRSGSPAPPGAAAPRTRAAAPGAAPAALSAVTSFRRSLKLLGLQPRELGLPDQPPVPPPAADQSHERRSRSPGPTFTTRLRSRSVSLDDLRAAARQGALTPDMNNKDGGMYRMISSAVYEEWYFRKQQQIANRQREQRELERRAEEEMEKRKAETQRKSQEKFQEWLSQKTRQLKARPKDSAAAGPGGRQAVRATHGQRVVTPERAERAFLEWKRAKDGQRAAASGTPSARAGGLPAAHAHPDTQARKADAEKAYQMWKKRVEEQEKKGAEKKRRTEEKKRERLQLNEEEKKDLNVKCFARWKADKEEQLKKMEESARKQEARQAALELEARQQRQYEAQQAFLAWLDDVEEREASAQLQPPPPQQQQRHGKGLSFRPARRHSCSD